MECGVMQVSHFFLLKLVQIPSTDKNTGDTPFLQKEYPLCI